MRLPCWPPPPLARGFPVLAGALAVLAGPLPARSQAAPAAEEGRRVFETVCVACHTVGAGARIGPDLHGVTERRTMEWLRRQIGDPESLRQAGDSIAAANRARYGVPMPDLGLSDVQVDAVIAHLGGAVAAPARRPTLYLPTLAVAVLAIAGFTLSALAAGRKQVETRA